MTRSVPEKTFEHWCAIHLSYRYKAKQLMWWPSSGADIEVVVGAAKSFGKRFWLELKTTEWVDRKAGSFHELRIDLDQLRRYGQQSIPDYYVFPIPPWIGVLPNGKGTKTWLGGVAAERIAYESHSGGKWFARFTWVVPGGQLRKALAKEIAANPTNGKAKNKPFSIARITNGSLSWTTPELAVVEKLVWHDFLRLMEVCGNENWPSQFLLPPNKESETESRSSLASKLLLIAEDAGQFEGRVSIYNPIEGDFYHLAAASRMHVDTERAADFRWKGSSRGLVTLTEKALRAAE